MAQPVKHSRSTQRSPVRPVAVIDIGATSIRMAIAEIRDGGEVRTLDTLVQSVNLGRDAFESRRLSRKEHRKGCFGSEAVSACASLEYGIVGSEDVRVVATSAVREASNRLAFTDRIFVVTGLNVEPLEEAEVNRITYMGVMPHLLTDPSLANGKSVVVEVGGGSTEVLVIRAGNVLYSQSYRLGSLRLLNTLERGRVTTKRRRSILESHIRRTLVQIAEQVSPGQEISLVAIGGDIRFAAHRLLEGWDGVSLAELSTEELAKFTDEVLDLDDDAIVKKFGASFIEAETLVPALLAYSMLAQFFELQHVYVCETNLRDGLLHDMTVKGGWTAEFRNQIVRSATSLGRKFDFDEMHARNVAELSKKLFQQLQSEHGLAGRYEVILYVAALLHEIGMLINVRSNHKHTLYIIRNSDLFGLSKSDLLQVGLVARYYRRASPQSSHDEYGSLPREERVAVSKMASLLRLATALDDTRSGRIREIDCSREGKRLVIKVPGVEDVSLEQIAMRQNSGLFRDVFGMQVLLRPGK